MKHGDKRKFYVFDLLFKGHLELDLLKWSMPHLFFSFFTFLCSGVAAADESKDHFCYCLFASVLILFPVGVHNYLAHGLFAPTVNTPHSNCQGVPVRNGKLECCDVSVSKIFRYSHQHIVLHHYTAVNWLQQLMVLTIIMNI